MVCSGVHCLGCSCSWSLPFYIAFPLMLYMSFYIPYWRSPGFSLLYLLFLLCLFHRIDHLICTDFWLGLYIKLILFCYHMSSSIHPIILLCALSIYLPFVSSFCYLYNYVWSLFNESTLKFFSFNSLYLLVVIEFLLLASFIVSESSVCVRLVTHSPLSS